MPKDYIFRYKLDLESAREQVFHHHLTELVRQILESLLNIIVPLKAGRDVNIDGFRWLMDRDNHYEIFPEPDAPLPEQSSRNSQCSVVSSQYLDDSRNPRLNRGYQDSRNAAFYEPRIDLLKNLLEALLPLVELEKDGQVTEVDGFRLRNLQDWSVPSSGDPAEVFDYAGSHCNCNCVFCCNKGNSSSVVTAHNLNRSAEEEFEEMKTRIKYFSPQARSALFSSLGTVYEVTMHPHFLEVLHLLREKSPQPFRLTTNGSNLTPDLVAELTKLKPIYLYLSLNSSSPSRRQKLMRDSKPEIAINALSLLRQYGIPYATVIVPWPVGTIDEMLEDLSSTVAYAAKHETHLIEVNLPGYSRYFSSTKLFDLDEVWKAIVSRIRELRENYDCPIIAMPTLYEENLYQSQKNLPQIIGVVKNSPAYRSGLMKGDMVLKINNFSIRNRPQARDILYMLNQSQINEITIAVQRNSQTFEASLDLTNHSYPYSREIDGHLGIIFRGTGLRVSYIEELKQIIQAREAKRVLFLSSALLSPTFEQCISESHLFSDSQIKIDIEVPQNRFFGGNIFMGDLLVVQDFIDFIKEYMMKKEDKPDLVVIPSSPFNLSGWGRDLTGRAYLDIERETGVPVELLPCSTIYD